jgi:hypothetical protein
MAEYPYPETGLTEETRKQIMAEIDRQIAAQRAMMKHHNALMGLIDEAFGKRPATSTETWLIRQLKNMRVDAQLSGLAHEADVLTLAIEELGGTL